MRRALFISLASITLAATLAGTASADRRLFTRLYHYSTMSEGKTALELWHTQARPTWDGDSEQLFAQTLELEHGITDRLDIGFLTTFAESTGVSMRGLHLDTTVVQLRYRFAERADWPVDVMLQLAAGKEFGRSNYPGEVRAVASRDFDKLTVAANVAVEVGFGSQHEPDDPEVSLSGGGNAAAFLGAALGATYQLHNKVELGVEGVGSRRRGSTYLTAGPVVSFALTTSFWLTVSTGFGVTDVAEAFSARAIVGIEL